jgi:quercetin dioxygenase-like cupin family protein
MRTKKLSKMILLAGITAASFASGGATADTMTAVNPLTELQPCGGNAPPGCQHVLLRGDPKTGASQHLYEFSAGFVFVKHWHVSNENLVMTKGTLLLAADGQSEMTLNVGDYLHIPAKLVHWGVCNTECAFYLMVDGPDSFNVVDSK